MGPVHGVQLRRLTRDGVVVPVGHRGAAAEEPGDGYSDRKPSLLHCEPRLIGPDGHLEDMPNTDLQTSIPHTHPRGRAPHPPSNHTG